MAIPWYRRTHLHVDIRHFGCTKVQPYIGNEYIIYATIDESLLLAELWEWLVTENSDKHINS